MTNGDSDNAVDPRGATPEQVDALRPIFRGGRFDEGRGYPATALGELAAYAKLVEAVALRLHRDREKRQRAERGYAERIRLRLRTVEHGSQVPVLSCAPEAVNENRAAADAIVEQLSDLSHIDAELQRLFKSLGRTLSDDESIELPSTRQPFRYTRAVRSKILHDGGRPDTAEVAVLCRITRSNTPERDASSLTVRLAQGSDVRLHMDRDEIRHAVEHGKWDRLLQVRGTGLFPAGGRLSEIAFIEDMRVIDEELPGASETLMQQFDKLKNAGAELAAPPDFSIESFRFFLEYCIAEGVEARPYIVATDDGIEAEWHVYRTNVTATLLDNDRVYVHVTDLEDRTFREKTVTCDYPGALQLVKLWRGASDD